ncbi:DUF3426 domain-containing protein [Craterilacuibacter sp.]|uniref:DUF3426 domain-containing protein n=1 Tax=Craterilacuibacter sp. TaxID=2870909 RepID=UPI003F2BE89F
MPTTQCPQCQTRFKVSDAQLAVASGFVRCGRCAHVFNASDYLQDIPPPVPAAEPLPARTPADDFELELPDFDPADYPPTPAEAAGPAMMQAEAEAEPWPAEEELPPPAPENPELAEFQQALADALRSPKQASRSIEPPETPQATAPLPEMPLGNPFDDAVAEPDTLRTARTRLEPSMDDSRPPEPAFEHPTPAAAEPSAPADHKPASRRGGLNALLAVASISGLFILAGQLVYLNRTRISAELPELRPTLEQVCTNLGCTVPLPTDRQLLRTEWSELTVVPDHPGLVQFTATLKNHARYPQAWPAMELTLTDSEDRVLVRKVLPPAEYLPAAELKAGRFAAGSQVRISQRFDAARLGARNGSLGYSVNWLYP